MQNIQGNSLQSSKYGMGLSISKMIVQHFNGDITFLSTHMEGSTFTLTFDLEDMKTNETGKNHDKMEFNKHNNLTTKHTHESF